MFVCRPRAVGAPRGAAGPSPRLDAVLRAGQARLAAPTGAPAANPTKPMRSIEWHQLNPGAFVGYTPDPLHTFISNDEMNAYEAARMAFESLRSFYQRGSSGLYPVEKKKLRAYSTSLPMSEPDRRSLASRLVDIENILATDHRPKRNMNDNREYIEVLERQVQHINDIATYQMSTDAKIWRHGIEGVW